MTFNYFIKKANNPRAKQSTFRQRMPRNSLLLLLFFLYFFFVYIFW